MKNNSQNLIAMRVVEGLLLLVVIIGVVWLHGYVKRARGEVALAQAEVLKQPEVANEYARLMSELDDLDEDIEGIDALFLEEEQVADFIGQVERYANSRRVEISVVGVSEVEQGDDDSLPGFKLVEMRIDGRGNPDKLLSFLHMIENAPYLVAVSSWEVGTALRGVTPANVAPAGRGDVAPSVAAAGMKATISLIIKSQ